MKKPVSVILLLALTLSLMGCSRPLLGGEDKASSVPAQSAAAWVEPANAWYEALGSTVATAKDLLDSLETTKEALGVSEEKYAEWREIYRLADDGYRILGDALALAIETVGTAEADGKYQVYLSTFFKCALLAVRVNSMITEINSMRAAR